MDEEKFDELMQSMREGAAILKGEMQPSRKFVVTPVEVKAIRRQLGLSQREFASLLGVSVDTVQNWEQNRRQPRGAARLLLLIARRYPDLLRNIVEQV